jgi:hypothetical protein
MLSFTSGECDKKNQHWPEGRRWPSFVKNSNLPNAPSLSGKINLEQRKNTACVTAEPLLSASF